MNNSKLEIKRIVVNPKSKKKRFIFLDKHNTQIKDPETLSRVKKIVIPPAYTDIKIANNPNNYLQAVGIDDKGRKQYVYKKSFVDKQSKNKYCELKHIGEKIIQIQKDVRALMLSDKPIDDKNKMIALCIYILNTCYFRIGNIHYFKEHQSHGVSTLQTKHLTFKNNKLEIEFIGKKGVLNNCSLDDALSVKLLKELYNLSKKEKRPHNFLFYYRNKDDKNNNSDNNKNSNNDDKNNDDLHLIKPTDINDFLNQYHPDITLKMFRTWGANYIFLEEIIKKKNEFMEIANLKKIKNDSNSNSNSNSNSKELNSKEKIGKESDKLIKEIIKTIALRLHNTPTVSKKSYLDNNLVQIYLENPKSFWMKIKTSNNKNDLTVLLCEFLQKNCNKSKKTKKINKQNGGWSLFKSFF